MDGQSEDSALSGGSGPLGVGGAGPSQGEALETLPHAQALSTAQKRMVQSSAA